MMRRLLLVVCLAWIGAVAGLYLGAAVTPEGEGLAGPAVVFVYGALGAAAGLVSGVLGAWKLSPDATRPASTAALAVAVLFAGGLGVLIVRDRTARSVSEEKEGARQRAAFAVAAVAHPPDSGSTFVRISVDGSKDTFQMTDRRKQGHPVCRGVLRQDHRLHVLDALRRVDALLQSDPAVCAGSGEPVMTLRWTLPERSEAERSVEVTEACNTSHPEFTALYVPIDAVAFTADLGAPGLECDASGVR